MTITSFHATLLHHGMIIVGLPYTAPGIRTMKEVTGGTPYGASSITGHGDEARMPSELELGMCRFQGEHVARIVRDLVAGRAGGKHVRPEGRRRRRPRAGDAATPFRFYDNRQKYLAFVNTCNEKSAVAQRAAAELKHVRPTPPALRIFDAGMGDATVLRGSCAMRTR